MTLKDDRISQAQTLRTEATPLKARDAKLEALIDEFSDDPRRDDRAFRRVVVKILWIIIKQMVVSIPVGNRIPAFTALITKLNDLDTRFPDG